MTYEESLELQLRQLSDRLINGGTEEDHRIYQELVQVASRLVRERLDKAHYDEQIKADPFQAVLERR